MDDGSAAPDFVAGTDLVVARFGSWPNFHDAEIERVDLDRAGVVLTLRVFAFTTLPKTDSSGFFERANQSVITFVFSGVEDVELDGFNAQNAIDDLSMVHDGNVITVEIAPLHGLGGQFVCRSVEVRAVEAIERGI